MLNIYLGEIGREYCKYNDAWFDKYADEIQFSDTIIKIIEMIDKVRYIGNQRVISKFMENVAISVKELSTGCKTVINVASFPNTIFTAAECGGNALQVLFNLKRGNVYLPFFVIPEKFNNEIKVIYNGESVIVHNNIELEDILYKILGGR